MQRINEWEMALAIALAPYTDGGKTISRNLANMRRRLEKGDSYQDAEADLQARITALNRRRFEGKEAGSDGPHDVAASVSP